MRLTSSFTRRLCAYTALAGALVLGTTGAALAQAKKIIRVNHAGADDVFNAEHQMFAWIFANYVNEHSPTLEVKLFPNSGLGQSRQVIEAMQLGTGASMHIGGMAEFANFCKQCGVLGLPFIFKGYDHVERVLDGPVGKALAETWKNPDSTCCPICFPGATGTSSPPRKRSRRSPISKA